MLRHPIILVPSLLLLQAGVASARLGGDVASVQADGAALRGSVRIVATTGYEVHEIQTDTHIQIREYVRSDGRVFALSWSGPVPPDLQTLLGSYFEAYSGGLASIEHPGLRRALRVAAGELVVETSGHLRAYAGRAYLPALLPAGVSLADLHL